MATPEKIPMKVWADRSKINLSNLPLVNLVNFTTPFEIDIKQQIGTDPAELVQTLKFTPPGATPPPKPVDPNKKADRWGIPFWHPTKENGFFYEMSDDPKADPELEGLDAEFTTGRGLVTMKPNGPTSFSVGKARKEYKDSIGGCTMSFAEAAKRGYTYKPDDVRDLEFKCLMKINGVGDHGFSLSACTGHHDDGPKGVCCQGFAYMANVEVASKPVQFRFRKEMYHVSYHTSPEGSFTDPLIADFKLDGHGWFGFGFCRYNTPGRTDAVTLELWFNPNPAMAIGSWKMIKRIVDKPGNKWGDDGDKCKGAKDQVGTWSGPKNRLKTNATSGTIDFKSISFREIVPAAV